MVEQTLARAFITYLYFTSQSYLVRRATKRKQGANLFSCKRETLLDRSMENERANLNNTMIKPISFTSLIVH